MSSAKSAWVSLADAGGFYIGVTDDLAARLIKHNEGGVPHTVKWRPRRIKTAAAFRARNRAAEFERYLKTGSGRAFAKKRYDVRSSSYDSTAGQNGWHLRRQTWGKFTRTLPGSLAKSLR